MYKGWCDRERGIAFVYVTRFFRRLRTQTTDFFDFSTARRDESLNEMWPMVYSDIFSFVLKLNIAHEIFRSDDGDWGNNCPNF